MRLLILMVIKAAVFGVITLLAFDVGRCSAVHEICDFKHGRLKELSDDIINYFTEYDKK